MATPKKKTFLNYALSTHQDVIINYFIPSIASCLLYIILFASDTVLVWRHFKDNNPIWGSLTLFIILAPSLCSYIVIISNWELWPEMLGCGRDNLIWFLIKTQEHLLFPVWAMWRYAERLFWSIEAFRSTDDTFIQTATATISAPRTIELYFFFQAFVQSLPQMLIQLNILMRQDLDVNRQTADAEVLSLVFNLTKLAATITFYQRFKTQKLAGKQYPWFKEYKKPINVVDSRSNPTRPQITQRRRSSDFYMEASDSGLQEVQGVLRETSVVDGPRRKVYQEVSEPDFNVRRVAAVKGMPDDDLAGKLVSFIWWFCFLLVRILAIAAFFFFYPNATVWLLAAHFVLVIAFLVYDVKMDDVRRGKALFFVFLGLIYIFCIIEFKIKFKKTKFLYLAYFSLVFVENFTMCMVWWFKNVAELENDFWFRYIFYIVVLGSLFSFSSMILYLNIFQPKKVVVGHLIQ